MCEDISFCPSVLVTDVREKHFQVSISQKVTAKEVDKILQASISQVTAKEVDKTLRSSKAYLEPRRTMLWLVRARRGPMSLVEAESSKEESSEAESELGEAV